MTSDYVTIFHQDKHIYDLKGTNLKNHHFFEIMTQNHESKVKKVLELPDGFRGCQESHLRFMSHDAIFI